MSLDCFFFSMGLFICKKVVWSQHHNITNLCTGQIVLSVCACTFKNVFFRGKAVGVTKLFQVLNKLNLILLFPIRLRDCHARFQSLLRKVYFFLHSLTNAQVYFSEKYTFEVYFSSPTSPGNWEEVGSEKYTFSGPGLKVYF